MRVPMRLISWHTPVARQKALGFRELQAWRMISEIIEDKWPITISCVGEANHLFHSSDGLVTWESPPRLRVASPLTPASRSDSRARLLRNIDGANLPENRSAHDRLPQLGVNCHNEGVDGVQDRATNGLHRLVSPARWQGKRPSFVRRGTVLTRVGARLRDLRKRGSRRRTCIVFFFFFCSPASFVHEHRSAKLGFPQAKVANGSL